MNMYRAIDAAEDSLSGLSRQLLDAIDTYRADQDGYVLGLRLARLMSLLRLHFAREGSAALGLQPPPLEPDQRRSFVEDDLAHARQLRRRADATRRIAERLEQYAARYGDVGVAIEDFATFQYDTHALVGELAERVDRERQDQRGTGGA